MHYTRPLNNGQLGSFNYVFNYTDHLGNVRVSFAKDPQQGNVLKILEENHYYPFGMKHENYNVTRVDFRRYPDTGVELVPLPAVANASYNYKYNGKELQEELGLNVTAMDFRQYDNALGRFLNPDRLSELAYSITPYRFAFNNPNFFADPLGLAEETNLARCPTCPNTPEYKPFIDDPKNEYVYDPQTKKVNLVHEIEEVVIRADKTSKTAIDYFGHFEHNYNGLNDILIGGGLTQLQKGYNNNFDFVNRQYYNFYKASKGKLNIPKPGQQRQILKKLLSTSKFSKTSKLIKGAGVLGAGLTITNIAIDGADGSLNASSIIDGSLLLGGATASAIFPPAAPFIATGILIYGIADYIFEINDTIDANTNEVKIMD